MHTTLQILQIIWAALLSGAILLQAQHGTGFGSSWGGGGETYHTRRGIEKVVFNATLLLAGLFLLTSVALLIIR